MRQREESSGKDERAVDIGLAAEGTFAIIYSRRS
jgi:hypothetical protein